MGFVRAAALTDVPEGTIRDFSVAGKEIALANVAGRVHAISNTCLHRGGPLGQGMLVNTVVTCPWHAWQFDVTSGKAVQNASVGLDCYPVEIRDDGIFVDVG